MAYSKRTKSTHVSTGGRPNGPARVPVGWREFVHLPSLGAAPIKAKMDTGARTCSLHAEHVQVVKTRHGERARFVIYPHQGTTRGKVSAEARLVGYRWVKDSGGRATHRPVIETIMKLGDDAWPVEITLAARDSMGFRMLVGRNALKGRFVVDPGRSFLVGGKPKKKRRAVK